MDLHLDDDDFDKGEFHIEGCTLAFYLKPYHLQLTFKHELNAEGEGNRVVYKKDRVTVKVEKGAKGVKWDGLDEVKADASGITREDEDG